MTTINIKFKTAPIALIVLSGAIFLLLIYINGVGHLEAYQNIAFALVGILFFVMGLVLYYYSTEKFYEDRINRPWYRN